MEKLITTHEEELKNDFLNNPLTKKQKEIYINLDATNAENCRENPKNLLDDRYIDYFLSPKTHQIWIISSDPGNGKSLILKLMQ